MQAAAQLIPVQVPTAVAAVSGAPIMYPEAAVISAMHGVTHAAPLQLFVVAHAMIAPHNMLCMASIVP